MNQRSNILSLALCASLVTGCASQGGNNQLIGTLAGALTGAASGAAIGGDWKGALIGAAAGAALGWGTAKLLEYRSTQVRSEAEERQIYGVTERVQSPLVKVQKGSNSPSQLSPGGQVQVATNYSVLLPQNMTTADVDESWVVKKDGKVLMELPPQHVKRNGGGWQTNASFAIPKNASPGTYVIEHKVQSGTSYDTDESVFVISAA
jgi:hypothetical protein